VLCLIGWLLWNAETSMMTFLCCLSSLYVICAVDEKKTGAPRERRPPTRRTCRKMSCILQCWNVYDVFIYCVMDSDVKMQEGECCSVWYDHGRKNLWSVLGCDDTEAHVKFRQGGGNCVLPSVATVNAGTRCRKYFISRQHHNFTYFHLKDT